MVKVNGRSFYMSIQASIVTAEEVEKEEEGKERAQQQRHQSWRERNRIRCYEQCTRTAVLFCCLVYIFKAKQ